MQHGHWGSTLTENDFGKDPGYMPERGKLFICIGLPRSGKTTFCNQWVQGLEGRNDCYGPRAIVCADDIRLALTGERFNGFSEPMVGVLKALQIETLLRSRHNVIVSGTHTTEHSLRSVYKIDPDAEYYLVDTPVSTCIQRAAATGQEDLFIIIRRMNNQLKKLKEEGIDRVIDRIRATLPKEKPRIQP